jgi:branched-chain amino acid aminotransferase
MSVIWLNGGLVAAEEARISALDRGVLSGYGLFETLRAYKGLPWAFDDHYERLRVGAELIDLVVPEAETLRAAIAETLAANDLADAGVRFTVTAGSGPADAQADPDDRPNVIVLAWPLHDYTQLYAKGATFVTISEGGRPLAAVKTTSYAVSVAGRVAAKRAGADDALFLGGHNRVLEATGSNLFVVRGKELLTPTAADAILPGVTRRHVFEVASGEGFEVGESTIYLDDLRSADEVILTSSLREVYPAGAVDGVPLNIAGHATRLRTAYHDYVLRSLGV